MKHENDKYKLSGSRFYTKCNRKLLEQNAPMIEDSLSPHQLHLEQLIYKLRLKELNSTNLYLLKIMLKMYKYLDHLNVVKNHYFLQFAINKAGDIND